MSVKEKTMIGTIDLTPTWEQQAQTCIAILTGSTNPEAISVATNELLRMGRMIDLHINDTGARFAKREL